MGSEREKIRKENLRGPSSVRIRFQVSFLKMTELIRSLSLFQNVCGTN